MSKITNEIQSAWRMDAAERMQRLITTYVNTIEIHPIVPIIKYYRIGAQIIQLADVYKSTGDIENQFILYTKFTTLFLEKIPWHPEYKTFDPVMKREYKAKIKEIFPIAAQLKIDLLARFEHENSRYKRARGKKDKRSIPPSDLNSLTTENLKQIIMPAKTATTFLEAAAENTKKKIETIGILAGRIKSNGLVISHVIIPKQTGTHKTCQPTDDGEVELSIYQCERNLITFGWIHTHPTQQAFLSSIDLHTQYIYQMTLPEAVAVVYTPIEQPNTRFFRIPPEDSLLYIGRCEKRDFHAHKDAPILFEDATHVQINENLNIQVADLRKQQISNTGEK